MKTFFSFLIAYILALGSLILFDQVVKPDISKAMPVASSSVITRESSFLKLPSLTTATAKNFSQEKTETPESVSEFTEAEFFDLPPNDFGYRGENVCNLIRAEPHSS